MSYLGVLRNKELATLWIGQVFSAIGDALYEVAITWFAVKALGNRAGLIVAAGSGSALMFSLFGGVYADRWNRRRTMVAVDILRAFIVLSLPVAARFGPLNPWHLALVTASLAILGSIFSPSLTASLPLLAPERSTLRAANALMDSTWRIARAIGPSLTGFLIAQMPLQEFFSLDAISFGVSAMAVFRLGNRLDRQIQPIAARPKALTELAQTFKAVSQQSFFFWTLVLTFFACVFWSAIFYVGVALLCKELPKGNIAAFGMLMGSYGCASVASNLFWGGVNPKKPAIIMFGGDVLMGLGFLLFAQSQSLTFAALAIALGALGGPMGDLVLRYLIQHQFPNEQIGKVYSLRWTIANLGVALGLLISGPVFQILGTRTAISVLAYGYLICGGIGLIRFFNESIEEEVVETQAAQTIDA